MKHDICEEGRRALQPLNDVKFQYCRRQRWADSVTVACGTFVFCLKLSFQ